MRLNFIGLLTLRKKIITLKNKALYLYLYLFCISDDCIQFSSMHKKQHVIVEGETVKQCSVGSGIPKGAVLGHLFFLCHINYQPWLNQS